MLLMLIALSAEMAAPPLAALKVPSDEVVVVGRRIKHMRMVTRYDRKTGATACIVRRSSGDTELDDAVCEAVLACAKTEVREAELLACLRPRISAIADRFAHQTAGVAK